ncbi:hypothetical protein F5Y07DRAFT_383512 [Xylaria sp. FL0933]|nr:hypothetical protein F5Y07DRAFT_383512 [Xylaria sp. FL0933]
MLLRRLRPGMLSVQSWSAAYPSKQIHWKAQCPSRGANLRPGPPNHEKRRFSRFYSNYAPRGPPPYYNPYAQQPRSRASRLKDMAIGSALTIIAHLAYESYDYWQLTKEMEEEEQLASNVKTLFSQYDRLVQKVLRGDDGSPERTEEIRTLLKERAIALTRAVIPKHSPDQSVTEVGPLPRLPEDHKCQCHEVQRLEDGDTLMLIPPQPSAREIEEMRKGETDPSTRVVAGKAFVAINAFAGDVAASEPGQKITDPGASKFHEILCRSALMLDKLCNEGIMDEVAISVTVFLWDDMFFFIYDKGEVLLVVEDAPTSIMGQLYRSGDNP